MSVSGKQRLPAPGMEYDPRWAMELVQSLENILSSMSDVIQEGYTTSNVSTSRTLDAAAASTNEVADVLATLVEDMKARGMLG